MLVLVATLAGCQGGGAAGQADPLMQASGSRVDDPAVEDLTPLSGRPGVDYAPDTLDVFYRAELPDAVIMSVAGPYAGYVSKRHNGILRENSTYEGITAAIAGRYNLVTAREIYIGGCNLASFTVPAGVDAGAALAGIRAEYAAVVEAAGYMPLARAGFTPNDSDYLNSTDVSGPQWGNRRIGCSSAWDTTLGDEHVLVAVVDTGVNIAHEELANTVLDPQVYFPDAILDLVNDDNTMEDTDGHGTAIAGLVCAELNNNTLVGVAPFCPVIPVKIANNRFSAGYSILLEGVMLGGQLGAKVINLSWYGPTPYTPFNAGFTELMARGKLVTICAGNDSSNDHFYPGFYRDCMCVGATETHDFRSSFSNYGTEVDIAAPGEALRMAGHGGVDDYRDWEGTSFAAPLVAGAAALLWSAAPNLTVDGVRYLLENNGNEALDFGLNSIRVLDISSALPGVINIEPPHPDRLINQAEMTLAPVVTGEVDGVELYVDQNLEQTLTGEPWEFTLELTGTGFKRHEVEFRAVSGEVHASAMLELLVDHTQQSMVTLDEDFEDGTPLLLGVDVKDYAEQFLAQLKRIDPGAWDIDNVRAFGEPHWELTDEASGSSWAYRLGFEEGHYDRYETDVLVTPALNIPALVDGSFSFQTRYNIEDGGNDLASLLYTTDGGQTFTPVTDGVDAVTFTGYTTEYGDISIDTANLPNEVLHLVFLFESDGLTCSEEPSAPSGWWLDNVSLAGTALLLGGIDVVYEEVPGALTGGTTFTASLIEPVLADEVDWWLDFAPYGVLDEHDYIETASTAPFSVEFDVSSWLDGPNQRPRLRAVPRSTGGDSGPEVQVDAFVFNYAGDVDCDGDADAGDHALFSAQVGLAVDAPGFDPLFDSDLDGMVTEVDAAYVGYNFGTY